MASLSSHIIDAYEAKPPIERLVQSGNMAYDASVHGLPTQMAFQTPPFPAYAFSPHAKYEDAIQIAELQSKLNRQLGPEFISTRAGPGGGPKLTYVEGWKAINLANDVFRFDGWSSSVTNLSVDFIDFNETAQRYSVGVTAVIRVTLRSGAFHEDIGYGGAENIKSKGAALDKCKKEAVTDGIKRALRNFGNVLGNCLYDKTYIKEISKIKVPPAKFDKNQLHRCAEFTESGGVSSTSLPVPTTSASSAISSVNAPPVNPTNALASSSKAVPQVPISSVPAHVRATSAVSSPLSKPSIPPRNPTAPRGLLTPAKTPVQARPAVQPQNAVKISSVATEKPAQDTPLLQRTSSTVSEGSPESIDFELGAHLFGSDDDALYAEVDLNAESYDASVLDASLLEADETFAEQLKHERSPEPRSGISHTVPHDSNHIILPPPERQEQRPAGQRKAPPEPSLSSHSNAQISGPSTSKTTGSIAERSTAILPTPMGGFQVPHNANTNNQRANPFASTNGAPMNTSGAAAGRKRHSDEMDTSSNSKLRPVTSHLLRMNNGPAPHVAPKPRAPVLNDQLGGAGQDRINAPQPDTDGSGAAKRVKR